jgi:hypothetical protein
MRFARAPSRRSRRSRNARTSRTGPAQRTRCARDQRSTWSSIQTWPVLDSLVRNTRPVGDRGGLGHRSLRPPARRGRAAGAHLRPSAGEGCEPVHVCFARSGGSRATLSNASGGRPSPLDPAAPGGTSNAVWSPDSRYVVYTRQTQAPRRATQVARIRLGSPASVEVLATYPYDELDIAERGAREPVAWSPTGNWILTSGGPRGLYLVTLDFTTEQQLTSRAFPPLAVGFSRRSWRPGETDHAAPVAPDPARRIRLPRSGMWGPPATLAAGGGKCHHGALQARP